MRRDPGRKSIAILAALVLALVCAGSAESATPPKGKRVVIDYVLPDNPEHKPLYDLLRQHQALERVQTLLVPIRWPRTLRLEVKGCDGESNAWYEQGIVTVCYEYLDDLWRSANSPKRPDYITREDAFVGPFIDVFLHEAGHAMFDLLKVPLLGREEDAADQVAAYLVLQLPKEQTRGLVLGNAYSYASELKVLRARDLSKRRFEVGRQIAFADEHGTPAQRLYNLLCVAYGSNARLFADVVEKGYLPKERAEGCPDEYKQIDFAYRRLISPHIDARR
jgi:putative metallopeptidase DUF4344